MNKKIEARQRVAWASRPCIRRLGDSERRRRGFTLIELLSTLVLLGAISILSVRLHTGSMRVIRDAPAAQNEIARREQMFSVLRADVWSASASEASAAG